MNIYFSAYPAIEQIQSYYKTQHQGVYRTGWAYHIDTIYRAIQTYGHLYGMYLVDHLSDADIELCTSQPPFKMFPDMTPNCYYTMSETTGLNPLWIDCLNQWNLCLNPSQWGTNGFRKLLSIPTNYIGFIHDVEKYPYTARNINGDWYYLGMGLGMSDRKNLDMMMQLFMQKRFPSDAKLTIKLTPRTDALNQYTRSESIAILYGHLSFERLLELYRMSHVSTNPSRGEGIGLIPAEHGMTGLCPIVSDFSALTEFEHTLRIQGEVVESPYIMQGGDDFEPDIDSLYQQMIWTYEYREEAMRMGKLAAFAFREQFNPIKFIERLQIQLASIKESRKILTPPILNFDIEWMKWCT